MKFGEYYSYWCPSLKLWKGNIWKIREIIDKMPWQHLCFSIIGAKGHQPSSEEGEFGKWYTGFPRRSNYRKPSKVLISNIYLLSNWPKALIKPEHVMSLDKGNGSQMGNF